MCAMKAEQLLSRYVVDTLIAEHLELHILTLHSIDHEPCWDIDQKLLLHSMVSNDRPSLPEDEGAREACTGRQWNPGSFALFCIHVRCRVSQQNKVSICLGHFAGKIYDNPNRDSDEDCFLKLRTLPGAGWNWICEQKWPLTVYMTLWFVQSSFLPERIHQQSFARKGDDWRLSSSEGLEHLVAS